MALVLLPRCQEKGEQILLERLYDKIWFGLGFALGMANRAQGDDK